MTDTVYILRNPAFPDLIKIGRTDNGLKSRISEISRGPGVPLPFECYYACEVEAGRSAEIERRLHFAFGEHRINPKREFFEISPERVRMILQGFAINEIDIDDEPDVEPPSPTSGTRKMRRKFKFSMIKAPIGSELVFARDDSVRCVVHSDDRVAFHGEILSVGAAAVKAFDKIGTPRRGELRGPDYWLFEDETLSERRLRLESDDDDDDEAFFTAAPASPQVPSEPIGFAALAAVGADVSRETGESK